MQDKLYELLMKEDEITWQSIILNLVKSEEMNPWDVDVSLLTKRYIETVKQLKETNFFISGKMVLASALLVKIKSNKLVEEDILRLDNVLFPPQQDLLENLDDYASFKERPKFENSPLTIKTPQARKRKVTVHDLIAALERALEVNKRRILKRNAWWNFNKPTIPEKKVDIFKLIEDMYAKIKTYFQKKEKITYSKLLPEENVTKKDKILTLYPLLYLETQDKINMTQQEHFGEIDIEMTA